MNRPIIRTSLLFAGVLGAYATSANAQTACSSLPHPVVVSGSTAIKTLLTHVAPVLSMLPSTDPNQLTIEYSGSGSCAGVNAISADVTPTGACATGGCVTGNATYYDSTGTQQTCTLNASGTHIDLALSDVFPVSCASPDTAHLQDTSLLVLPFGFIVPAMSSQTAIDTREAYFAFGDGMNGQVTPWNNESYLFVRDINSGTEITIADAIHIPPSRMFLGVATGGTGNLVTDVIDGFNAITGTNNVHCGSTGPACSPANYEASLGFAGLDSADSHRGTSATSLTELAYRHWGQNNYYWPDSTNAVFDKQNIRDGHYPLWSYEHAVIRTDASGSPVSAVGSQLAMLLSGQNTATGLDMLAQTVGVSLVPTCAMGVSRATDGGDFSLYTSSAPCNCYFNAHVASGSTTCAACSATSPCSGSQQCRFGYCEPN